MSIYQTGSETEVTARFQLPPVPTPVEALTSLAFILAIFMGMLWLATRTLKRSKSAWIQIIAALSIGFLSLLILMIGFGMMIRPFNHSSMAAWFDSNRTLNHAVDVLIALIFIAGSALAIYATAKWQSRR